jgi:hypothetical protein
MPRMVARNLRSNPARPAAPRAGRPWAQTVRSRQGLAADRLGLTRWECREVVELADRVMPTALAAPPLCERERRLRTGLGRATVQQSSRTYGIARRFAARRAGSPLECPRAGTKRGPVRSEAPAAGTSVAFGSRLLTEPAAYNASTSEQIDVIGESPAFHGRAHGSAYADAREIAIELEQVSIALRSAPTNPSN